MAAQAFCTGWLTVFDSPSMVTMRSVGLRLETGIEQERRTSPLICTEHAPHWATPQPYLVPVSPTCSRITHSSGVSASTRTLRVLPLTLSVAMVSSRFRYEPRERCRRLLQVGRATGVVLIECISLTHPRG